MTRRQRIVKWIIQGGSVSGALVAIVAAWHLFEMPSVAWSSDIKKLNVQQTDHALDFYSKAVRDDTILRSQISDPTTRALIDQRMNEAQDKLKRAQDRKIELSK